MSNQPGARVTVGTTPVIFATPAITASSAYTSGNCVGGVMTFPNAVGQARTGLIESLLLQCKTVQTASFSLWIFSDNPVASGFTDKSAPSIAAADVPKLLGVYSLASASSGLGTHTVYTLDAIAKVIQMAGTSLYALLTVTGTPTFASVSDVTVGIGVLAD